MSDDPTPDPPVADDPKPVADPPDPEPPEPKAEPFDQERAMATILKLREQEKDLKKRLKEADELKSRLDALEAEKLTEEERQQKRLAELEAKEAAWDEERREMALTLGVQALQGKLGIADTDLALVALDRSQVEYDKAGKPSNLEEVLGSLLERKPLLKGQVLTPVIDGGAGRRQAPAPSLTAEQLAAAQELGMDPESYAAMGSVRSIDDYQRLRASQKEPT